MLVFSVKHSISRSCHRPPVEAYSPLLCQRRWLSSTSARLSEPDYDAARKWHAKVGSNPITHEIGEVSYARSSGPGGQNVNKVNSKAQLRVSLDQLLPQLPEVLHDGIRKSTYYAGKTNSLLIQSDDSRKQAANKDTCFRKLNELVMNVYNSSVPGETSEDQKQKVKKLQKAENEARLQLKKKISSKKSARRGKGDD